MRVTPFLYWSGLALLLVAMYASLKLGVKIGRHQEFLRRSQPLLAAVRTIADITVSPEPSKRASHETINRLATKAFELHYPSPAKQTDAALRV